MAKEIEHKYTVVSDSYKSMQASETRICQGYLSRDPERTVRVRIAGDSGFLTIKGKTCGDAREEFEYGIPVVDAEAMLALCAPPVISKIRHYVPFGGYVWEVDEYLGDLSPLTVAEIELAESTRSYPLPSFIGKEVTGDPRYYNSNLTADNGINQ